MVVEEINVPWTRKHDDPRYPLLENVPKVVYPSNLHELIEVCSASAGNLRAAGRHWGLSEAAISDHTFIETNDPGDTHPPMSRTLKEVVPSCVSSDYLKHMVSRGGGRSPWYLAHVESGKRVCQLYAELDQPVSMKNDQTLAGRLKAEFQDDSFGGPWGMATLGGAAGQTIVGAFSTGTHGGDFDRPPIADSVVALHIIADGGQQYWVEPRRHNVPNLVDDAKLRSLYGRENGYANDIVVIRDSDVFDASLIAVGRFGAIYSVIIKAVPQYSLYERRRLQYWQDVKGLVNQRSEKLFRADALLVGGLLPSPDVFGDQHFLQIAVCLVPCANGGKNRIGITQRWTVALPQDPAGRTERVGKKLDVAGPGDDPRFENVGNGISFKPDKDDPHKGASPSILQIACSNASFLAGIIEGVISEIKDFIESNGAVVGAGLAAAGAIGGAGLLALIPQLAAILAILYGLLKLVHDDSRFGEVMNSAKNLLLNPNNPDPVSRAAGVLAWRMIYNKSFDSQQSETDYQAISYAVMDKHDYGDTCQVNVDSLEVFFDATDDRLVAFVDALILFETSQEYRGKSLVGYASLRFTGPTQALMGMERFATTCAIEVSCIRDITGGQDLIDYAAALARRPDINGIMHWGQRNDCTRAEIERLFGLESGDDRIGRWRKALDLFTDGGHRNAFSSKFSRRVGLEL